MVWSIFFYERMCVALSRATLKNVNVSRVLAIALICFLKSRLGIYFYSLLTSSIYQKIYTNNSFLNSRATSQYIIVGRVRMNPVDLLLLCFYSRPYHSPEQKSQIYIYINKNRPVDLLFYKQFLAEQRLESRATQSLIFHSQHIVNQKFCRI